MSDALRIDLHLKRAPPFFCVPLLAIIWGDFAASDEKNIDFMKEQIPSAWTNKDLVLHPLALPRLLDPHGIRTTRI